MSAIAAISPAVATAEPPSPREAARARRLLRHGLPRFLLVGCAGLLTDAALYSALAAAGAPDRIGRALSLALATLVTWRLNRRVTFAASGRTAPGEFLRYGLVALGAQGLNYGLFLLLRASAPALPPLAALLGCAGLSTAFSFSGHALATFGSGGRLAAPAPGTGRGA